jgi:hypothetical protein
MILGKFVRVLSLQLYFLEKQMFSIFNILHFCPFEPPVKEIISGVTECAVETCNGVENSKNYFSPLYAPNIDFSSCSINNTDFTIGNYSVDKPYPEWYEGEVPWDVRDMEFDCLQKDMRRIPNVHVLFIDPVQPIFI